MERRKELRFNVSLKVGATDTEKRSMLGLIKDFSRDGLRAVFDAFELIPNALIMLKIQRPEQEIFAPACAEIKWKKYVEGKWEVGLCFKDFVPQVKAEILDYGYHRWIRSLHLNAA